MSGFGALLRHVPDLRRHTYASTGSREDADRCVRRTHPLDLVRDQIVVLDDQDARVGEHAVPLIVITAYPERLAQAAEARPRQIVTKPFDYASLRGAITGSLMAPAAA